MSQDQQSLFSDEAISDEAKGTMDKPPINQKRKRYLPLSSVPSESGSTPSDQGRSRMESLCNAGEEDQTPRPPPVDIQQAQHSVDVGRVPYRLRRHITSPYILQRYLTIEMNNEPLRYEAHLGILEGRVREGEDMLGKKMNEEGWEEVDAWYEAVNWDLGKPTEEGDTSQSTIETSSICARQMSIEPCSEASVTGSAE